jgi:hypothetical protein
MITEKEYLEAKKIVQTYESEQLNKHAVSGRSEQFYCVSSDALVYGKPCEKWCGDENCKALCKQ